MGEGGGAYKKLQEVKMSDFNADTGSGKHGKAHGKGTNLKRNIRFVSEGHCKIPRDFVENVHNS